MKHKIGVIVKHTTKLPFKLYHKNYEGSMFMYITKLKVSEFKHMLDMLPEGEWMLIKRWDANKKIK